MIEDLIDKLISEGKITSDEIERRIKEMREQKAPSNLSQQVADIWELILFGGDD